MCSCHKLTLLCGGFALIQHLRCLLASSMCSALLGISSNSFVKCLIILSCILNPHLKRKKIWLGCRCSVPNMVRRLSPASPLLSCSSHPRCMQDWPLSLRPQILPSFLFPTYAYKPFNLFIEKSEFIFSRLISHQKKKVHTKECSPALTVMEVLTHNCVNGL